MVRKLVHNELFIIGFAAFFIFAVLPVIYTISITFFNFQSVWANLQELNISTFLLLLKSILLSAFVAFLATTIGSVLAFVLYKTTIRYSSFFKILLLLPLFISPYILAVAWKEGFFLMFGSTLVLASYWGVIIVFISIYTPLSMLIVGNALVNISSEIEDSALLMTSKRHVVLKIVIPLIKPALITSFILIFIFSISEFSVPSYFAVKVFTTEIFTQFSAFYNYSLAILQSVLLVLLCLFLLFAERKYIANAPFLAIGNKGVVFKLYTIEKQKVLLYSILVLWLFVSIFLPLTILVAQSFSGGAMYLVQAINLIKPTILNSFFLAFVSSIIVVFIGFTAAYYNSEHHLIKLAKYFDLLLLFIFAIPSIIFGISLIFFYNQAALSMIYTSYAILIIAFVGKFSFIASKLISNSLKQIPVSLDEAAQIQSIGFYKRLQMLILPLLLPAFFASFVISFIFIVGELGLSIMIYPPGAEIMSVKVYTIMANAPHGLSSAMSLIVFLITLGIIPFFYLLVRPMLNKYHLSK
ncbi:MAG: iron ABC transporter permease [Bacteroidales bacterium]|nr:iron ABC transporter permease [Bacteroidales bacterium]